MMRLVATTACRNEDWVLGLSARAHLMWADHLVIGLHECTDASPEIADQIKIENPGRVSVIDLAPGRYNENIHREQMLEEARKHGATHLGVIDADELITGNMIGAIRRVVEETPGHCRLHIPGANMRTMTHMHKGGLWGTAFPLFSLRVTPELTWVDGGDHPIHTSRGPRTELQPWFPIPKHSDGGMFHLQFVDDRRLKAKHAMYKCMDTIFWPHLKTTEQIDRQYNIAPYDSEVPLDNPQFNLTEVPYDWWEPYKDLMQNLKLGKEPWQEQQVRDWVAEYGKRKFEGLYLFGIV